MHFARIMAVLTSVSVGLTYLGQYFSAHRTGIEGPALLNFSNMDNPVLVIAIFVIANLFYFYSESTTYMSIIKLDKNSLGKEKEIFKLGYKKMWIYFLAFLVTGLIIAGGLILLVVPGIIFSLWYSQTLYLVLEKGMGIKNALKESKKMVVGKLWKLFGRYLVIGIFTGLVGMLASIFPYAGAWFAGFLSPLFLLPTYLMYKDLSKSNA